MYMYVYNICHIQSVCHPAIELFALHAFVFLVCISLSDSTKNTVLFSSIFEHAKSRLYCSEFVPFLVHLYDELYVLIFISIT